MDCVLIKLILLLIGTNCSFSKLFTFEIENFSPDSMRMPRSGASGNFTVLMKNGDLVHIEFCLRTPTFVSVRNIIYSNDGPADTIRTTIDGKHVGTFETTYFQDRGKGWNIFRLSAPLAGKVFLDVGKHVLTVKATASDKWGVEIDNVVFNIDDNTLEYEDILCRLYCFNVSFKEDIQQHNFVASGKFVQKSSTTQCSEQDNIKIEVFHDSAESFEITATLPRYLSFANFKDPSYDRCILASPYWIFGNETVSPTKPEVHSDRARMRFSGSHYRTTVTVTFDFKNLTPTREIDERLIGSVLFLKLRNMPRENVKVKPEYLNDGRWLSLREIEFTPFDNENTWMIQDRTWDVVGENQIKLFIEPGKQEVIIDELKLERRSTTDSTVELFADSNVVIEGVRLGFWHHWDDKPDSMTVAIQAGGVTEYTKIDSLRVYAKVPWTGGYSQVFVIFQDGRTRLQVITPHGLDYVPFGSSINIGQPVSTTSGRPYSPIERINFDASGLRMYLRYADGNKATFVLQTKYTETKLLVKDVVFGKNRQTFPVMTFQSMWIHDGNADTDHVIINNDVSRHITSNWEQLRGLSAVFYRKCISHHNTQAPDIKIKFLPRS